MSTLHIAGCERSIEAATSAHFTAAGLQPRDERLRSLYLDAALPHIPRLLGAIDRNPYRTTYGCCDRQYWHYRTSDFPSEMYQEAAWPLALVYSHDLPGNRWHGQPRVRELAIAALQFAARSCHRDGSCDDYYPYERALGAAVFSLLAAAQTYRRLRLDDAQLLQWLERRATWVARHDESGRLANHQALAALGLLHVAAITGKRRYRQAAEERLHRLLAWQSDEGWFEEYGGADPGYQTVTLDCLVKCRQLLDAAWLDEPIRRGVAFCRPFLHPDGSYGGEYGSRGTYHFYSHGFELLAKYDSNAADLADGFLQALAHGKQAHFDDDRLVAHRLGNLIEAYLEWSPVRRAGPPVADTQTHYFPGAGLLVRRSDETHTVVSAARGGVFKHFAMGKPPVTDAGLIVELADGRVAVSQSHELTRRVEFRTQEHNGGTSITICGPLHRANFETATPVKFIVLRLLMLLVGRWQRTLIRRLLQRRLITGRKTCPISLSRRLEFFEPSEAEGVSLRVIDRIELTDSRATVRRMSYGVDHQAAYVAACGVYQDAVLQPWQELDRYVAELNSRRRVEIVRSY